MRARTIAAALAALLWSVPGVGGTGSGNGFSHRVNQAFDFHVASPPSWGCEGCDDTALRGGSDVSAIWRLVAPERTTWLETQFITEPQIEDQAQLASWIAARHPEVAWHRFERSSFVGFTSSALADPDAANEAIEYYLVAKRQVIRIAWRKDGSLPSRAVELDLVKASIDRAAEPPRIERIETERQGAYRPGDEACYLVEVDDLKAEFTAQSLRTFEIEAAPSHWSFKRIAWVPEKSWFRVCFTVTKAFGPSGLTVRSLSLDSDSRMVSCEEPSDAPKTLLCKSDDERWQPGAGRKVTPRVAAVDNPRPDRRGPTVRRLALDPDTWELTIDAEDESGLAIAEVTLGGGSVVVYADQLASGAPIGLARLMRTGWNTVSRIVLYDGNGLPTLLQLPKAERRPADGAHYEVVTWEGEPEASSLPVVAFLVPGRLTP